MATKLIIVFPMRDSKFHPPIGRFRRSERHDAHIWDGREYDTTSEEDMNTFNAVVLPALSQMADHPAKTIVRAVYEAPIESPTVEYRDEAPPIPFEPAMPKRRGRKPQLAHT